MCVAGQRAHNKILVGGQKGAFELRSSHVPEPGTSGDAFRKVQDSGASSGTSASVIGRRRMGAAARAALWSLPVIPSPWSVRASLMVFGCREEGGANRGPDPVPRGHYF